MVDNNIAESCNAWIKDAIFKPIIGIFNDIILRVMNRIAENRNHASK